MHPQSVTSSIPSGQCAVKQSAIVSAINRIYALMARLGESVDYTESVFSPALRPTEPPINIQSNHEAESDLHRELLSIEAKAESILNALDSIRARSTL